MLGKDKGWNEMTDREQSSATLIGYSQAEWDEGEVPAMCMHPWNTLESSARTAAQVWLASAAPFSFAIIT